MIDDETTMLYGQHTSTRPQLFIRSPMHHIDSKYPTNLFSGPQLTQFICLYLLLYQIIELELSEMADFKIVVWNLLAFGMG